MIRPPPRSTLFPSPPPFRARPRPPPRRRTPAPPTRLDPVHHEVRDDQDRDRRLHIEEERQERRAERGKAEADGPLHERGDENGEGGAYEEGDSAARRTSAGWNARRPARGAICWRHETPGATITVSAGAAFTAGTRRRLPSATEMS